MPWSKVPPATEAYLDRVMAEVPGAEKRRMFGCPAYFINGNMLGGAFQDEVFLRFSAPDQEEMLQHEEAHSFTPMPGRPMLEYVTLPPALVADEAAFLGWARRAAAYAATVPPKPKKAGKGR